VGIAVFVMVTLGTYTMLIRAYELSAQARARDEARAVLRTFGDQFERLQTTDEVGGSVYMRWLFLPTGSPTGRGLRWGDSSSGQMLLSDWNTSVNASDVPSLAVTLGSGSYSIPAQVTREVHYVDESTGVDSSSQNVQAAGYLLRVTFTIAYKVNNRSYSQSLTVARAVP